MGKKKGVAGKDAFARMNFLYQASVLCSSFSSKDARDLAAYYGSMFRNVAKKAVVRAEPEIKRTLCKGCNAFLIPGDNAKIRLRKKPSPRLIWTCLRCFTIKRFGVRKNYKMWLEREESTVESVTLSNKVAAAEKQQPPVGDIKGAETVSFQMSKDNSSNAQESANSVVLGTSS